MKSGNAELPALSAIGLRKLLQFYETGQVRHLEKRPDFDLVRAQGVGRRVALAMALSS